MSTADFLRLADGGIFYATLAQGSVLTAAPPAAFGFLSGNPAGMAIQESVLQVPEGKTLSVVAGDVQIRGGQAPGVERPDHYRKCCIGWRGPGQHHGFHRGHL
ncbi:MAG: hypothetical protein HY347_06000 [candidate division NC10 bacterium]|nr:hypothetical protein [candidate division NC10 bacterium]